MLIQTHGAKLSGRIGRDLNNYEEMPQDFLAYCLFLIVEATPQILENSVLERYNVLDIFLSEMV